VKKNWRKIWQKEKCFLSAETKKLCKSELGRTERDSNPQIVTMLEISSWTPSYFEENTEQCLSALKDQKLLEQVSYGILTMSSLEFTWTVYIFFNLDTRSQQDHSREKNSRQLCFNVQRFYG
jgi:hypothetical protein